MWAIRDSASFILVKTSRFVAGSVIGVARAATSRTKLCLKWNVKSGFARRLVFQLAEVAVPREVVQQGLERIGGLHPAPE